MGFLTTAMLALLTALTRNQNWHLLRFCSIALCRNVMTLCNQTVSIRCYLLSWKLLCLSSPDLSKNRLWNELSRRLPAQKPIESMSTQFLFSRRQRQSKHRIRRCVMMEPRTTANLAHIPRSDHLHRNMSSSGSHGGTQPFASF